MFVCIISRRIFQVKSVQFKKNCHVRDTFGKIISIRKMYKTQLETVTNLLCFGVELGHRPVSM